MQDSGIWPKEAPSPRRSRSEVSDCDVLEAEENQSRTITLN
jgi:hypothetical protein